MSSIYPFLWSCLILYHWFWFPQERYPVECRKPKTKGNHSEQSQQTRAIQLNQSELEENTSCRRQARENTHK